MFLKKIITRSRPFLLPQPRPFSIIPFKLADIGEGIAEVELLNWYVKEGDKIAQFDKICEVQSDKATVDISSRYDGVIKKLNYEIGDMPKVGEVLVEIDDLLENAEETTMENKKEEEQVPSSLAPTSAPPPSRSASSKGLATPAVRRMLKENALDIHAIDGSGKDGRVTKSDVLNYLNGDQPTTPQPPSPLPELTPTILPTLEDTVVPIRGITRLMGKSMTASLKIPHFNLMEEIEMDELIHARTELKKALGPDTKLSYMPFFIKASSLSLMEFPILNATTNDDASEMIYRAEHNISVAMDTPKGIIFFFFFFFLHYF